MSSGSHLSRDLHDLVKAIGETRSKQEEDKIIIKEVAQLKVKLQEKNIAPKKLKEHLMRGIYIEMLGHDASFAHIQAVNLTNSKNLGLKKMGYLCCSLFLENDSELLILLVANLQKDLASSNVHIVVIALTAVAKLISKSFVSALVELVLKLLTHNTDIIRKKVFKYDNQALMVLQIIRQINPDCVSDTEYDERMRRGIQDKEPSVMGAAFNLYHEELKKGNINKYKNQTSNFVSMLKQIIEHKLHKDYDYHRFPAPWLQIKLLQILSILGANDLKVSEQIYEVLGSTLRRADDTTINIGYAVTYQCVKTIATLYPNQSLLEQAANSVSRFLKSDNNNLKYLGINALTQIVSINSKYVIEHQMTIVDCLESQDDTLKKETLELLFKMTNENNFEVIIQKLINILKQSNEATFKKDLFIKISLLNEKHAPTQEWFIRTANTVFEFGPEFIDNEVLNNFFRLLIDNYNDIGNEFGEFIVEIYMELIIKPAQSDNIIKMVSWVIGEIGSQTYEQDTNKLNEMTVAVAGALENRFEDETTKSWILTSLAKLQSARGFQMYDQTGAIFQKYQLSRDLDCQQRAIDFLTLAKYNAALKRSSQVNVDVNLSFLDKFVADEKARGAQSYQTSLQMKAAALGGNGAGAAQELNFDKYDNNKYMVNKSAQPAFGTANEPTKPVTSGLKANVKEIWSLENGYQQPEPVQAPKPAPIAMGSGGAIQGTKPISSTGSSMQSMSGGSFANNTDPAPLPIQYPPKQPKEDPNLKSKQQLANSIFGPTIQQTTTQTQKKGISAAQIQPPKQNLPQQGTQQGTNVAPKQQPAQATNLLDFDISGQQKQQNPQVWTQSQQQPSPVLSQPQNLNTGAQKAGGLFNKAQVKQPQQSQQQAPQVQQSRFQPALITTAQYESYWESIEQQQDADIKTTIKSEQQFRSMIQALNLNVVEVIDQDIISAGFNPQTKNMILIYGAYDPSGNISFQVKSKDSNDITYALGQIKNLYS